MENRYENNDVLSEFFLTASRVSEIAAKGLSNALKDAPQCHFDLLTKIHCLSDKEDGNSEAAVSDFVKYTGLSPQAVSRILRGLESEGLIERRADASDHRRTLVRITESGEKKRLICQGIAVEYLNRVMGEFGIENVKKVNELNILLLDAFKAVEEKYDIN